MLHFKRKWVGTGQERKEKKFLIPTRTTWSRIENFKKKGKKIQKIKKQHLDFI